MNSNLAPDQPRRFRHHVANMDDDLRQVPINEKSQSEQVEYLKKTITLDTLHGDEAVKVLAGYDGDLAWSAIEEKKLVRKIDRRLLTILCITYGLQYYDKAMLSQAVSCYLPASTKTVPLCTPEPID